MPDISSFTDDSIVGAITGTVLALAMALLAYRFRWLTASGAVATTFVGGAVVAGAGWWAGWVLIAYFATSSALSRIRGTHEKTIEQARGKRRDAWQVLANGGIPALLALAIPFAGEPDILAIGCLGGIAAAAADTWATEIGKRSVGQPRLITSWQVVPAGTSGAVSWPGSAGAVAGAAVVAMIATFGWHLDLPISTFGAMTGFAILLFAGVVGALADSLIGATVQERRWCPHCNSPTEQRIHRCGTPTVRLGGWEWMTNDVVNASAIALAAGIAMLVAALLGH